MERLVGQLPLAAPDDVLQLRPGEAFGRVRGDLIGECLDQCGDSGGIKEIAAVPRSGQPDVPVGIEGQSGRSAQISGPVGQVINQIAVDQQPFIDSPSDQLGDADHHLSEELHGVADQVDQGGEKVLDGLQPLDQAARRAGESLNRRGHALDILQNTLDQRGFHPVAGAKGIALIVVRVDLGQILHGLLLIRRISVGQGIGGAAPFLSAGDTADGAVVVICVDAGAQCRVNHRLEFHQLIHHAGQSGDKIQ